MCARYTQLKDLTAIIAQVMCFNKLHTWRPRFNIAPSQAAPVLAADAQSFSLRPMQWGLIPSWAKDKGIGSKLINARSESLLQKPAFRSAYHHRRCLIPADGFYEWAHASGSKIPHRFSLKSDETFCFAGLWESWIPQEPIQRSLFDLPMDGVSNTKPCVETFTIITTVANSMVRALHDRMPVILLPTHFHLWLEPKTPDKTLQDLMSPLDPGLMKIQRVSRIVNDPRFDDPRCLIDENQGIGLPEKLL